MTSLEVTHSDGTKDDIDETLGWSRQREIGGMRRVVIDVERSKASGANLDAKEDNIDLGSIDTVRLVDIDSGSSSWRLTCYSAEWLANTVPPTAGGNLREGTDNALVTGLIGDVPAWTAGTVDTLTSGLSFVHNHAHIHEALRRVERNVPGEIQFRDFGVVDYLDSLGSDKTGSVTLSAANANIESEIRITNRGRELDGTHIRVLGAHEGEAQYFANLVPSTDPASYDNRVDYTTSRWSSGDTKDWDVWSNKDVADQDTIEAEAAAIGEEIEAEYVEAETVVPNSVGLEVGDWVHVEKSDADLDRDMRVHRITTKAGSMNDTDSAAAVVDAVLLSTRTTMRQDDSDVLADVKRFNSGYQGASVWGTVGPVEQNVETGEPLEIPFFYPDIEYENKVEVYVDSRAFRYYVSPADHNHDVSIPSHQHGVSISDSTTSGDNSPDQNVILSDTSSGSTTTLTGNAVQIASFSITEPTSFLSAQMHLDVDSATASKSVLGWMEVGSEIIPADPTDRAPQRATNGDTLTWTFTSADNHNGDTATLYARYIASETMDVYPYAHLIAHGRHTHSVSISDSTTSDSGGATTETTDTAAGILTGVSTTNDTVSDADLKVNGSVVHSSIGSGTFQGEFDISNELNTGAWNTIEIDPTGTGRFMASVAILGYRQIGAG